MKCFLLVFFSFIEYLYAQEPLKLLDHVKPEHYNLRILSLLEEQRFEGSVDILLKCYSETKVITLHAAEMLIIEDRMSVKDEQTKDEQKISGIEMDKQYEFLKINLQKDLVKNQKYILHVEFQGQLQSKVPRGFYVNSYPDEQGTQHYICNTHFEPTWARYAFPCFDLPHMKATFEITIGRNEKQLSLSNMPLRKSEPIQGKGGFFWDYFEKTSPMATYIVAFAVLDDGMKHVSSGKITYWFPPTSKVAIDFALKKTQGILKFLEKYFDMQYELRKLDFLMVLSFPAFAGACENWGLIILKNEIPELDYNRELAVTLLTHELVHQWIGNLITMKCFGNVWLKEGITSYLTSIAKDNVYEGQTFEIDTANSFIEVMNDYLSDKLSDDYCPTILKDIMFFYRLDVYQKGGLVTRMLELSLGLQNFGKTANSLLKTHKFGNIVENDLWVAAKQTTPSGNFPSHFEMDVVWTSWTRQEGFPLVEVTRNYKTGTATLTQRKFYTIDGKNEETCWWIPVSYTTKYGLKTNNTVAKSWMGCPKEPMVITGLNSSDWILTNLQSMGLFIVKYDDHNWKLLSETLKDEKSFKMIPYWSRFRLVLDSFFLTDTGLLSHESFLSTLTYLQHETHPIVWMAALNYLNKLDWLEEEVVRLKKKYMKTLVKPHFSKRLFDLKKFPLKERKFNQMLITQACFAGHEACIEESFRLFEEFKKSFPKESSLDKDIRREVFCIAVRFGPPDTWFYLVNILPTISDDILLSQIVLARTCSTMHNSQKMLNGSRNGRQLIFDESIALDLMNYYKPILKQQPDLSDPLLAGLIPSLHLHDESHLNYFKKFLKEIGIRNNKIADKLLRIIQDNIEWTKKYSDEIKIALSKILGNSENIDQTPTTRTSPRVHEKTSELPALKISSEACTFQNIISLTLCVLMCILFLE